jgi:hypothetical protein
MLRTIFVALLPFLLLFGNGSDQLLSGLKQKGLRGDPGTLEKMIVANGSVSIDLNVERLNGANLGIKESTPALLGFNVERDSFFTAMVYNGELRGILPSSMALVPQNPVGLPAKLSQQLVVEASPFGSQYELVIRDGKTGFAFFNVEGQEYGYVAGILSVQAGRLLISKEFAAELGRPSDAGTVVGNISITATMRPIEITKVVDGEVVSNVLPALNDPDAGSVPGPDVVVGDLSGLAQFGSSSGTRVGLAVGTDSCNFGTVNLNWFALPNNDHPVIPQNLYRMSGGAENDERFEQIGQSNVKHAFTALQQNLCSLGCQSSGTGTALGSGCSDPYSAGLNAGPNLGSRAWINPFTGAFPAGSSGGQPIANDHSGHTHSGAPTAHKILTEINDLVPAMNPGATYYAEAQYVTPHEYAWCQANPGQCNMYNNVSYRRYTVTASTSPFSFSPAAATQRAKTAISAWPGATLVDIKPEPGVDGVGTVAYKVTNPSPGVWHYEYAVYNENIDRAIQSFGIPLGSGVTLSNIGFHAPPQHPGWSGDGTIGNTGYSSTPWTQTQAGGAMTWSSETFAQNQNANAIRWGSLYNFRFDSNRPPQNANATIGFFKTGSPITVQVQVPSSPAANVSVSGRVTSSAFRGIRSARVTISDSSGNSRMTTTSSFGYYRFENVVPGVTYTISVAYRDYVFTPQVLQINDNLTDVNFSPQQ